MLRGFLLTSKGGKYVKEERLETVEVINHDYPFIAPEPIDTDHFPSFPPLISYGFITFNSPVPAGIEEVSTIYILQKLLPAGTSEAKLVPIPGIQWDTQFHGDEARRQWHESKMQSKLQRAAKHLELLLGVRDDKDNNNDICNTVLHL